MYIIVAAIEIKEGFKEQYINGLIENANSAVWGLEIRLA